MAYDKRKKDQVLACLAQIEYLLNQIVYDKDINHKTLANIDIRTRDINTAVKKMSQDVSEISRMLYDSYRYASPELITTLQSQVPGKKRILLVGFYGAPNLGDELMCLTVLDYLREKLPDAEFTVMCTNSDSFNYADAYFGANILHYPRGYYDENVIANSFDAIIVGGGALIDDSFPARGGNVPGTMNIGRVAVELPKAFGTMGKPSAMLGLSTNDKLEDPQYIDTVVTAIAGTHVTTIRDPYSLDTLLKCGAPEDRMALCPDIVASDKILYEVLRGTRLLLEEENEAIKSGKKTGDDIKRIMVTWISSDQESMSRLASIVEAVAIKNMELNKNVRVCLVPFLQEFNTDENMATALRAILSDGANGILETPKYTEDIGIVCNMISACDYAVNMRYHGGLLAALLGLPGVVVIWEEHRHYHNKMKHLAKQFADFKQVDSSRFDAMTEVEKAFNVVFGDEMDRNRGVFNAGFKPDKGAKRKGVPQSITTIERRILRLNETEKICLEAQDKMEGIISYLAKLVS